VVPINEHHLRAHLVTIGDTTSVHDSVEHLVRLAAHTFDTPYAGVTLIHEGGRRFETAGPTSSRVRAADELQNVLREGPCVDASAESHSVVSNDIASDERWPRWGSQAARLGFGSILSSALWTDERRIGALNIYGAPGRQFTPEEVETARVLADHAAVALHFAQRIEGLHIALDSRTLIGQAQGILMATYGIDANRAFAVLKRHSQDQNVRLVRVAQAVVDGVAAPIDHETA
jgi:GAF domain-containing protein